MHLNPFSILDTISIWILNLLMVILCCVWVLTTLIWMFPNFPAFAETTIGGYLLLIIGVGIGHTLLNLKD